MQNYEWDIFLKKAFGTKRPPQLRDLAAIKQNPGLAAVLDHIFMQAKRMDERNMLATRSEAQFMELIPCYEVPFTLDRLVQVFEETAASTDEIFYMKRIDKASTLYKNGHFRLKVFLGRNGSSDHVVEFYPYMNDPVTGLILQFDPARIKLNLIIEDKDGKVTCYGIGSKFKAEGLESQLGTGPYKARLERIS